MDPKDWLDIFPALDNPARFNILIFLHDSGPAPFSDIKARLNLTSPTIMHHLDKLMGAGLVCNSYRTPTATSREYSYYMITDRGKQVLDILLKDK